MPRKQNMKISPTSREERVVGLIEDLVHLFQEDLALSMP